MEAAGRSFARRARSFSSLDSWLSTMNVRMWQHAATQRNLDQLKADGVRVIEPAEGEMACGEFGPGRLPEPQEIMDQLADLLA